MAKAEIRLVLLVIAVWLGTFVGLYSAVRNFMPLLVTALISIGILFRFRNRFGISIILLLVLAGAAGFIRMSWIHSVDLPETAEIRFEVLEDVRKVANPFDLNGESDFKVLADTDIGIGRLVPLLLTVKAREFQSAKIGSQWSCIASLDKSADVKKYVGYGTCFQALQNIRGSSRLQNLADAFRTGLREVSSARVSGDAAALLPGLVLGDTSAQSKNLETQLQLAGLGHLTAVSGANVAIILLGLEVLLGFTRLKRSSRLVILALAALLFMLVARPSPSVVRATAMALLGLAAAWFGWQRVSLLILLGAVLLLLLIDPFLAVAIGFWLSVAATFGLIVFPKFWKVAPNSSWIWKAFTTALAAVLATLPVLVAAGLSPSFVSIPANMLAEVLVAPATLAGVIAAVLQTVANAAPSLNFILHPAAVFAADFGVWPARGIVWIATTSNQSFLQQSIASPIGWLIVSLAGLAFGFLYRNKFPVVAIATSLTILISVSLFAFDQSQKWRSDWQVAVCDVGQGDATVLRTNANRFVLIDVGGDSRKLQQCLKTLQVSAIEMFVASHFHADHVGAVEGLNGKVTRAWMADSTSPAGLRDLVISQLSQAVIQTPKVGTSVRIDDLELIVLQNPTLSSQTTDGSEINNASLVFLARFPTVDILFTGDIETAAQHQLMQTFSDFQVDVVKVPHHGSAAQHPEFATWTRAKLGWISVGAENSYGHPASSTLAQYQAAGIALYTTVDCGLLGFEFTAAEIKVRSQKVCPAL